MSVIRMSKMHVRPRCQNPWQLASPLSLVVVGGVGVSVGGGGGGVGVVLPSATLARRLTHEKIRGSRSTRQGERGECGAAQVPPLISYILMPDMDEAADFAGQFMLD